MTTKKLVLICLNTQIKKAIPASFILLFFTLSVFSQQQHYMGVSVGSRFEKPIFLSKGKKGNQRIKQGFKYSLGYLRAQEKSDIQVSLSYYDLALEYVIGNLRFATDIAAGTTSTLYSQVDISSLGVDFLFSKNLFKVRKKSNIKPGIGVELNYLLGYKSNSYVIHGSNGWVETSREAKYEFPAVNIYPVLFLDYQYRLNDKYLIGLWIDGKMSVFGDAFPLIWNKSNRLSSGVSLRLFRRLR